MASFFSEVGSCFFILNFSLIRHKTFVKEDFMIKCLIFELLKNICSTKSTNYLLYQLHVPNNGYLVQSGLLFKLKNKKDG